MADSTYRPQSRARYSGLTFVPDPVGDILFDGIAQDAYKQNVAYALQSDAAYKLTDEHTLRGGLFVQSDRSISLTTSSVIALDETGTADQRHTRGNHR